MTKRKPLSTVVAESLVTWNCNSYHYSARFWEMMRWQVA